MIYNTKGQVEYADNDDQARCLNGCGCVAIEGDYCCSKCYNEHKNTNEDNK